MFEKAFKWIKNQRVPRAFDNKFLSYLKKQRLQYFCPFPKIK